jgi:hypothetical protein
MSARAVDRRVPNGAIELAVFHGAECQRAALTPAEAIHLAENLLNAATSRLAEYQRAVPERVAGVFSR